ncbi:MAG TPA: RNA-directed DNA polymerase, partial [Myxococcales bacterium]
MTTLFDPTLENVLLAFRQAKNTVAAERDFVGRMDLARFEMRLGTRLGQLQRLLGDGQWFDQIGIGGLLVLPKAVNRTSKEQDNIVRIGVPLHGNLTMKVRFQLAPSPEFATAEVLYLWEFGGALEAMLDDSCLGYRLKRVAQDGTMDQYDRSVYEYWPAYFERYRSDPIAVARQALKSTQSVLVTSTDVVSFFDSIDPRFLIDDSFVSRIAIAAAHKHRPFSTKRFVAATTSLLRRFREFRELRREAGSYDGDDGVGIPIGALTSRVFANVALSSVDSHIQRLPHVLLYRRYVDDIVIVSHPADVSDVVDAPQVLGSLFPGFSSVNRRDRFVVPATRASFDLNADKTRVHLLQGAVGLHFLSAVQRSFSAVTSERRAFIGDVGRLTSEFAAIKLSGNDPDGAEGLPRLRDADRFTLRRFMSGAYVRALERCAVLLSTGAAAKVFEDRTRRMLDILESNPQLEDFEFVLDLLKIALLC